MGKAENTKQFIVEKIAPVFNKKGYLGTTLTDLTNATSLTKGALYSHFENKEKMAHAALEYNINTILDAVGKYIENVDSYKSKLLTYLDFYQQYFPTIVDNGGCPFMNTAIDSDDTESHLFENVYLHFNIWRNLLIEIIKGGKRMGEFRSDIGEEQFADMFIAMIEGGILLSKTLGSDQSFQNNIQFLRNQIASISI